MDRPALLQSVRAVLVARGVSLVEIERSVAAIAGATQQDAVVALLEARRPGRAAWMATIDGGLHLHGSDYLLTDGAEDGALYGPDEGPSIGGGRLCWSTDGRYRRAYRYGPLDGRRLCIAPGCAVKAGELLTDGELDFHALVEILGGMETLARMRDRLVSLCDLDPAIAEMIIVPMLDIVEIMDVQHSGLRVGARMSTARFQREIGRVVARQLPGLPASADPRLLALVGRSHAECAEAYFDMEIFEALRVALPPFYPAHGRGVLVGLSELARLDAGGRLPGPEVFRLGSFEVTAGKLRVCDPGRYQASAGPKDLYVESGTWRAESIVEDQGPWGPRVSELWAWSERHAPELEDVVEHTGFLVAVDSGLAGFFDVSARAGAVAICEDFSGRCCQRAIAAGPPQAAIVENVGVVAFSGLGDGAYACKVLREELGPVTAVSLVFLR